MIIAGLDTIGRQRLREPMLHSRSKVAEGAMERFVHEKNLELLQRKLEQSQDEAERQLLLKLLKEEIARDPEQKKARLAGSS